MGTHAALDQLTQGSKLSRSRSQEIEQSRLQDQTQCQRHTVQL